MSKPRRVLHFLRPLLCLFLVSGSLLTSPAAFAHRDVFTTTYTLGATKPLQFTASPNYRQLNGTVAVYTLTVQNGAADGSNRITSGEVLLGGIVVIPDTELTALAGTISKTITPGSSLTITLKDGPPGAFIKITITRHIISGLAAPVVYAQPPYESGVWIYTASPISIRGRGYIRVDISPTMYSLYYDEVTGLELRVNDGAPRQPDPTGLSGTFSNIALNPGVNTFVLSGRDYENNMANRTWQVWLDSASPQLTVTAPANNSVVTNPLITVTGTATDDIGLTGYTISGQTAGVKINGTAASLSGNNFTTNITLSAGVKTVTIVATDQADRTTTVMSTVSYDAAPPQLTVTAPANNAIVTSASLTVSGTVTDDVGVPKVTVNGQTATLSGSTYTANVTLLPGANTLTVVATDKGARTTTVTRSVTYDAAPPQLTVTAPADNSTVTSAALSVTGTVSDDTGVTGVTVNGAAAALTGNNFSATVTLSAGANTLTVVATDKAARNTTVTRTVSYDAAPPQLTVTAPADNSTVTSAALSVTGTVSDDTGVTGVTVNGAAATLSGNTFTTNVTLTVGANTLTVVATDKGLRTTTVTRTVTYNATPLQVSITNPLPGAILDSDTTLVSGTFNGPPNIGITVNGIVAETSGATFYASNVPLLAGANTLTATATTASGATATQSITVTSTGKTAIFQVTADPQSGIAPLKVKFTVTSNTTAALTKIEADYDGNGVIDFTTSDPNAVIEYTYTTPGVYQASIIVTDNLGQAYTSKHVIVASSVASRDTLLRGVYNNLLADLRSGNIEAALQSVTGGAYEKYKRVFTTLKPDLPNVVNNLGTLEDGTISNEMAEYVIVRNTADGPQAFLIYFIRSEDGVWRIDGM